MIAYALQPWIAMTVGSSTLVVYAIMHWRTQLAEQDASGIALLCGSVLLLTLQLLEFV